MIKSLFKGSLTIPNLLSVIRIILIPVFAYMFLEGNQVVALVILFVSGLTDLFDGKIARKFNQVSELGKILDPVADKLTQITIAIMLFILFRNSSNETINAFGWVFLVFLIKEAVMIVGGLIMLLFNIKPGAAELPGKVATGAFYAIMIAIIGFGPEVGVLTNLWVMPDLLCGILVVISAILTLVAFASYMPETFRQFKERFSKKQTETSEKK
ncbi:MAG: CDP-alcohol phosphatidyltransferase family protein [Clostridia bacterium]|nr:CDP-alcohol phosphatidyltransferase family protein [Clostridia bacterium]